MGDLHPITIDLAAIEARLREIVPTPGPADTADADWPACLDDTQLAMSTAPVNEPWGLENYAHASPALVCHRCIDGEVEWVDERGYRRMKPCRCHPLRRAADLVNRARIPAQFAAATQGGYDWSRPSNGAQVRAEMRSALTDGAGLLLAGTHGTGKSHLAVAVVRRAALRGESSRFWRWQTLVEALTAAEFRRLEAYGIDLPELMRRVLAGRWLVIDDLLAGGTAKIERQGDILRGLLERAMDAKTRLVITSNLTLDEIGRRVADQRIISRLRAAVVEVVVEGEDQRVRRGR